MIISEMNAISGEASAIAAASSSPLVTLLPPSINLLLLLGNKPLRRYP
jgi:hypothetical protein